MDDICEKIKSLCSIYENDDNYVYSASNNYFMILKKIDSTLTNENRKNIMNIKYACYKANELYVVCIYNRHNPSKIQNAIKIKKEKFGLFCFEIGKMTCCDNVVNYQDLYLGYYKTPERAFYGKLKLSDFQKKDGIFKKWSISGLLKTKYTYVNGHFEGIIHRKYSNMVNKEKYMCINGKKHGTYMLWNRNGYLKKKSTYTHGILNGENEQYYDNCKIKSVGDFKNGKKNGIWKTYYYSGNIETVCSYEKGELNGRCVTYNDDVNLGLKVDKYYKNNKLNGFLTKYSDDGEILDKKCYINGKIINIDDRNDKLKLLII